MTQNVGSPLVLVVDSGVGGLSICREIRKRMPHAGLLYVADNAWFPYGGRGPRELEGRLLHLLQPLCEHYHPDVAVIACNTASTSVLPHLRQALALPIVGVVPAVKPAARESRSKVVGLLATPGTVGRSYVDDLIAQFAADCNVVRLGSERLVHIAEAYLRGTEPDIDELRAIMEPMLREGEGLLDTVVLGCTHFPLVSDALALAVPEVSCWIDSGEAIARRIESVARQQPRLKPWENVAVFTEGCESVQDLQDAFAREGIVKVRFGLDLGSGILP